MTEQFCPFATMTLTTLTDGFVQPLPPDVHAPGELDKAVGRLR